MGYKPQYDHDPRTASNKMTVSGRTARENISIEENEQRRVAESEAWLLATIGGGGRVDATVTPLKIAELS